MIKNKNQILGTRRKNKEKEYLTILERSYYLTYKAIAA